MAIEFIKDTNFVIQVYKIERNHENTATCTTNLGYIDRSKIDGKIHFCGYRIEELEIILAKMKELQGGNNGPR